MKRSPHKNKTPTMIDLQTDIKCQFKAWCAVRGKTMVSKIEKFMLETIKIRKDRKMILVQLGEDMKTGDIGEISEKDGLLYLHKEKNQPILVQQWKCYGCENLCFSPESSPPIECIASPGNLDMDWRRCK